MAKYTLKLSASYTPQRVTEIIEKFENLGCRVRQDKWDEYRLAVSENDDRSSACFYLCDLDCVWNVQAS